MVFRMQKPNAVRAIFPVEHLASIHTPSLLCVWLITFPLLGMQRWILLAASTQKETTQELRADVHMFHRPDY